MWDLWWTKWHWSRFSPSTLVPLPVLIPSLHTHHHLSSGAGTIGKILADIPSGLSLTPPQETKKKRSVYIKYDVKTLQEKKKKYFAGHEEFLLRISVKRKEHFLYNAKSYLICSAVSSCRWCWFQSLHIWRISFSLSFREQ
jgi:hypothetical protein